MLIFQISSFKKNLFMCFSWFSTGLSAFLTYRHSLCMLDMSFLLLHIKNTSLLCVFHFTALMLYCYWKEVLNFNIAQLSFKCFLYTISEIFPYPKFMKLVSYISRIAVILTFIHRSKTYLELIFVCDVRKGSGFPSAPQETMQSA